MALNETFIKTFEMRIFAPLLEYMPNNWLLDFDHVTLRFDSAEHAVTAYLKDRQFGINIDLHQLQDLTIKQLKTIQPEKKEIKINEFVLQFVGNLTYNVVQAFFRYNKQHHPEYTEGKTPEDITTTFLTIIIENARKNYNNLRQYVV